jgi:hypothetical protein
MANHLAPNIYTVALFCQSLAYNLYITKYLPIEAIGIPIPPRTIIMKYHYRLRILGVTILSHISVYLLPLSAEVARYSNSNTTAMDLSRHIALRGANGENQEHYRMALLFFFFLRIYWRDRAGETLLFPHETALLFFKRISCWSAFCGRLLQS